GVADPGEDLGSGRGRGLSPRRWRGTGVVIDSEWAGAADSDLGGRGVINNHVGASRTYDDTSFVDSGRLKGNGLAVDHSACCPLQRPEYSREGRKLTADVMPRRTRSRNGVGSPFP